MTGSVTAAPAALLEDVLDLAAAVALAGIARPDPDLPGELRELAARARALRLDEGAGRLDAFATSLERVSVAGPDARRPRTREAHDAFQRLVAWARRMRVEIDLLGAEERARGA